MQNIIQRVPNPLVLGISIVSINYLIQYLNPSNQFLLFQKAHNVGVVLFSMGLGKSLALYPKQHNLIFGFMLIFFFSVSVLNVDDSTAMYLLVLILGVLGLFYFTIGVLAVVDDKIKKTENTKDFTVAILTLVFQIIGVIIAVATILLS